MLPFVIKFFFEWPLKTGFTVCRHPRSKVCACWERFHTFCPLLILFVCLFVLMLYDMFSFLPGLNHTKQRIKYPAKVQDTVTLVSAV